MTSPAQRSTKPGAILFGVAYWVHIHLKPTSMCGINFVGGGGGSCLMFSGTRCYCFVRGVCVCVTMKKGCQTNGKHDK